MKLSEIVGSIGKIQPEAVGCDGFPVLAADPLREAHLVLNDFLEQSREGFGQEEWSVSDTEAGKSLLSATDRVRGDAVCALFARVTWITQQSYFMREERTGALLMLLERLLAKGTAYKPASLGESLELLGSLAHTSGSPIAWSSFLRSIEEHLASHGLEQVVLVGLMALKSTPLFNLELEGTDKNAVSVRVEKMIAGCHTAHFELGEPWADMMHSELENLPPEEQASWDSLLDHLPSTTSKPSKRWLKKAKELLEEVGEESVRAGLIRWLPHVGERATMSFEGMPAWDARASIPGERNEELLRGMIWLSILVSDETLSAIIGELAMACYKKLSNIGPRCPKLGNACIHALGQMKELSSVGQLWRLDQRIPYASARKMIAQAIEGAAKRHDLSVEDMEELSVPTFGLDMHGKMTRQLGDWRFELELDEMQQVSTRWVRELVNGQAQLFSLFDGEQEVRQNVPRKVRSEHAEELAELTASARELEKIIHVQSDRIEGFYTQPRCWPIHQWVARYIQHPVVSRHARRLIWTIEEPGQSPRQVIWHEDRLVDVTGEVIDPLFLQSETRVELWHPLDSAPRVVDAWRDWLFEHRVTQPFKQAHREVYEPSGNGTALDACFIQEVSPHVLKQHQFAALCKQKSWSCKLQGTWEIGPMPRREVEAFDISATFGVHALNDKVLTTRAGAYVYVVGNHVRFVDREERALALADIDPVIFSEVMRDVELFVHVAGITEEQLDEVLLEALEVRGVEISRRGNEQMSGAARIRRDVLTRVLPEYDWGARCELEGVFLTIHGEEQDYTVHLGTGIVRDEQRRVVDLEDYRVCSGSSASDASVLAPWLPFEGDAMLTTLLQRAWLLATGSKKRGTRRVV